MSKIVTGDTFGTLTVIAEAERIMYGGRLTPAWVCKCQCGVVETLPEPRLKKRHSCRFCARGPCVICGGVIPDTRPCSNTCSEICKKQNLALTDSKAYAKKTDGDPDFFKRLYKQRKEKIKSSPLEYSRHREYERQRSAIRRLNPERLEKERNRAKLYWQNNKDKLKKQRTFRFEAMSEEERESLRQRERARYARYWRENKEYYIAQRKAFWNSLSPEEKEARLIKKRESDNERKRKIRAWIYADPRRYEAYITRYRQYRRMYDSRVALEKMMADAAKLMDRQKS